MDPPWREDGHRRDHRLAQNQLSDIVYVEIVVSVGDDKKGEACATLESVRLPLTYIYL